MKTETRWPDSFRWLRSTHCCGRARRSHCLSGVGIVLQWTVAIAFVAMPCQSARAALIVDQVFTYANIYEYDPRSTFLDQGMKSYSNTDLIIGNSHQYGSAFGLGVASSNRVGVYAEGIANGTNLTLFSEAFGSAVLVFHSTIDTPFTLTSQATFIDPPSDYNLHGTSTLLFVNPLLDVSIYTHNTGGTLTWQGTLVANSEYQLGVNVDTVRYGKYFGAGIAIDDVNLVLTTPATVPEPSTFIIMGLGGLGLAIRAYRRRRNRGRHLKQD